MAPSPSTSCLGVCGSVGTPGRSCALALPACNDGGQGCAVKLGQGNRGRLGSQPRRGGATGTGQNGRVERFEQGTLATVRVPPVQQYSGGVAMWRRSNRRGRRANDRGAG